MERRSRTATALLFVAAISHATVSLAQDPTYGEFSALEVSSAPSGLVFTLGGDMFRPGGTRLAPSSAQAVVELAHWLGRHPERQVRLEGHTDSRGDADYNQMLSQRRAERLREALKWRGISPSRMAAVGLGEARPLASNDTEEGRRLNRRVEVVVFGR